MDWKLQTGQDMGNEGCTRRPSLVVWPPVKHLRSRIVRSHPGWLGQQSFTARGEKFFFSIRVFLRRHWRFTRDCFIFILVYYFHPLGNIHRFICIFGYEMTTNLVAPLVTTRLLLNEGYYLVELPFDYLSINYCFFAW